MILNNTDKLSIPSFFNSNKAKEVYRVPYQERAKEAEAWAKENNIQPSSKDRKQVGLLLIDVQNTFCIPDFELFVNGAIEDNVRLCEFIYQNLGNITEIIPTMDSHTAMQIFHPIFWINKVGEHPAPGTMISYEDVQQEIWQVNSELAASLMKGDRHKLKRHALYYVKKLSEEGKYPLTIWSYHSMLGGIGHALVSAIEEAVFFHSIARKSQTSFELKGSNPLTENYSVLSPEVTDSFDNKSIASKNSNLINKLLDFDSLIITGQAKSHCVAWTVDNLLTEIKNIDSNLAKKIYLLEDCMSPVVIPEIVDFTPQADAAFQKFAEAGMNIIKSTDNLF
ncbi:cysteine hydrolase family protein [Waterburya agarophytonicola K14]|uniref:Cysteine hydrolase family protein n=1 Tax=Waterburya agarophytonicola KI4 TaxID=2874699 RepID=A0A964BSP8_9CYAN|nr:cysteine hydrolase family protein [Waterburya agarophytonicola]MCC0179043.1 cysteine hydrolase family protein [Waterburya agarophytonicola KI4]